MKLIKLHQLVNYGAPEPVFVNADHILLIRKSKDYYRIHLINGKDFEVEEPIEKIIELLS